MTPSFTITFHNGSTLTLNDQGVTADQEHLASFYLPNIRKSWVGKIGQNVRPKPRLNQREQGPPCPLIVQSVSEIQ